MNTITSYSPGRLFMAAHGVRVAPCGASLPLSLVTIKTGFIQPAITKSASCAACQIHSAVTNPHALHRAILTSQTYYDSVTEILTVTEKMVFYVFQKIMVRFQDVVALHYCS